MEHTNTHYDTIVVGGRPSGATLAARLGQAGLRVLLLERASLPSAPAASCPAIYPATMRLLDEIGADEATYARGTPRLRRMLSEVRDDFRVIVPLPMVQGRDYLYAIDRARFDAALWQTAARSPRVDALQGFAVTELLRDGERVSGVAGRAADGAEQRFSADCVVGADGRFSLVARKAGARSYDQRDDLPTTIYYAYWRNVAPYDDGGPLIMSYGSGRGYGYLFMDSADGMTCVAVEGARPRWDKPARRAPRAICGCCRPTRASAGGWHMPRCSARCAGCATSVTCTVRPAALAGRWSAMRYTRRIRWTARASTTRCSPPKR
jgi:2-polyprenyl-6-methoxyphenol hydroxylase-like FAD-dependent oxidoreductase